MNGIQILSSLLNLSLCDHELNDEEITFIKHVGTQLELTSSEIEEAKLNYKTIALHPPESEKERMTILYYLLFFIQTDQKITPQEKIKVQEFGFQLGFDQKLTDELIDIMIQFTGKEIPPNLMLEKIKKYQN